MKQEIRLPIIALTAAVLMEEREQCYAAGRDNFLSKPVSKREIERVLDS